MGVSNVNNANKAQIVKLALANKNRQVSNATPEYMKMTGSIFDAPGAKENDKRAQITDLNTKESIKNLTPTTGGKKKINGESFQGIDDVSSGKAAMATGKSAAKTTEDYKKETEKDEKLVNQYSKDAIKLSKDIDKNDKTFAKKLQSDQKQFDNDNKKIQKAVKESEETEKAIKDAKDELDGLLASNSFKMGGDQNSSNNSARINELQTFIGSKIGMLQQNGKTIYSLQRSQTKTLTRMNKTNRAYVKTQKTNKKNIQSQEKSTNSVIDTAQKIETYSAMVQAGGQTLGLAGDGLIALGNATAGLFGSGAALIAVGTAMKKVGSVMELVGQYGQAAANITKTAAYAAEGNLMGAMMSATAAVQTGAAAIKSTTQIGKTWQSINEQARAAKQNIAAQAAAKDTIKNEIASVDKESLAQKLGKKVDDLTNKDIEKEALGGLTKKQARKYMAADIRENMAINEALSMDELRELAVSKSENALNNAKETFSKKVAGINTDNLSKKQIARLKNEQFKIAINDKNNILNKKLDKTFDNMAKYSDNGNWGKKLESLGGSITSIATVFMNNQAIDEMSAARKKPLPQYQMDARTRKIMQRNQMYSNRFSYV